MPFGSPDEVRRHVREIVEIFASPRRPNRQRGRVGPRLANEELSARSWRPLPNSAHLQRQKDSFMQPLVDPKPAPADRARDAEHFNMPFIWGISFVAAMGGLLFGWDFIVMGGAKPFYEKFFSITSENLSGWTMSCAYIGCLLGAGFGRHE